MLYGHRRNGLHKGATCEEPLLHVRLTINLRLCLYFAFVLLLQTRFFCMGISVGGGTQSLFFIYQYFKRIKERT
jgi:hypothetical protein